MGSLSRYFFYHFSYMLFRWLIVPADLLACFSFSSAILYWALSLRWLSFASIYSYWLSSSKLDMSRESCFYISLPTAFPWVSFSYSSFPSTLLSDLELNWPTLICKALPTSFTGKMQSTLSSSARRVSPETLATTSIGYLKIASTCVTSPGST